MGEWFSFVVILNQPPLKITIKFIMYHYVYYSYEEWGRGYIGVRSCKCLPEEDVKYFGSFKDKTFRPSVKTILAEFTDRQSAIEAEITLHEFYQVSVNPHFANRAKQLSTGYDRKGVPLPPETIQKYKEAYQKFREQNPDLYQRRKELVLEGIAKYRQNNPEKVKQQLIDRAKKAGEATTKKRKLDPELDLKMRKAVSESTRKRFTPEYQEMLITKAREVTSKPVIVTYLDGSIQEFETMTKCMKSLNVSYGLLKNKLDNLPTRKLKDVSINYKEELPNLPENYTNPQPDTQL